MNGPREVQDHPAQTDPAENELNLVASFPAPAIITHFTAAHRGPVHITAAELVTLTMAVMVSGYGPFLNLQPKLARARFFRLAARAHYD